MKRDAAYVVLLTKYKEIEPSATKDTVVKKINTLRTNYRREKKKGNKKQKKDEDHHEVFGKSVAAKMRDVLDHKQRLVAEKIINDTLFMAEVGQLKPTHTICHLRADSTLLYSNYCATVSRSSLESLASFVSNASDNQYVINM
ncbi:uncharacterized protein LOC126235162 [Schistocerca nitens]|uniref:uncharacterized protein LOC126235162 n=1 Tax=Schistocerca nitens TaxID=7011 RepID=UPI0021185280|nr:uncharacterized protein LOC126235162 [Schistocerca nitens]